MNKNKTSFNFFIAIMAFILIVSLFLARNTKPLDENQKKENRYKYKMDIKYPEEFAELRDVTLRIKANVASEKETVIKNNSEKKTVTEYYDKSMNKIYTIIQDDVADITPSSGGGSRGSAGSAKFKAPFEEGILYDENGRVLYRTELNKFPGYNYQKWGKGKYAYFLRIEENLKSLEPRYGYGTLKYTSYKYNEKGEIEEENIKELTQFNVRVTDKSYKNGKITKERIFYDEEGLMEYYNKIKVDIEKEYDENEKLIRKHVTRQNKHNAMRSETEFDLIKGEIMTKYFDGEKSFATVTETQVGKDKAIVKRERDGDEFVIWDFISGKNIKTNFKRFIINKNNELIFIVNKATADWTYGYNYVWNIPRELNGTGLDKYLYNNEFFIYGDENEVGHIYKVYEIVEINNLQLIKYKNFEENRPVLLKEKLITNNYDKKFREYLMKLEEKNIKIKIKFEKIKENYIGGLENGYYYEEYRFRKR